jgi:hypothetical protein
MNDAFTLAQLIDLVLAFTLLEGAALLLYHRVTGKGVAPRDFLVNMVSGLCLMLALRGLARDAGSTWIATCLLAAGLAHGADMLQRWRRSALPRGARSTGKVAA